jgi:hypothetical protein
MGLADGGYASRSLTIARSTSTLPSTLLSDVDDWHKYRKDSFWPTQRQAA